MACLLFSAWKVIDDGDDYEGAVDIVIMLLQLLLLLMLLKLLMMMIVLLLC